jgi:hypothetical protein
VRALVLFSFALVICGCRRDEEAYVRRTVVAVEGMVQGPISR